MAISLKTRAALHTLWQAAVASGGVGEIAKSVTDHSINVPGLEQSAIVAGVAAGAAGLSLVKGAARHAFDAWRAKSKSHAEASAALAGLIAEYRATHAHSA